MKLALACVAALACCACAADEAHPIADYDGTGGTVEDWGFPDVAAQSTLPLGPQGNPSAPATVEPGPNDPWFFAKLDAIADMVYDASRDLLYLSTIRGGVFRFDLVSQSFDGSWNLGGELYGMDLSPDSNTLLVAERAGSASGPRIHRIDLASREANVISLAADGGSTSVVFLDNERALVSLQTGLHVLTLADESLALKHPLPGYVQFSSVQDRSRIAYASLNDVGFGMFDVLQDNFRDAQAADWIHNVAVDAGGDRLALVMETRVSLFDAALSPNEALVGAEPYKPLGAAFAVDAEQLFVTRVGWNRGNDDVPTIEVFDSQSLQRITALDTSHSISDSGPDDHRSGRVKTSSDGRWLFASVMSGVVIHPLDF